MAYQLLVFAHIIGITILGGALIFGQLHQMRARRSKDIRFIAETYRTLYITIIPFAPIGGITLFLSGSGMVYLAGYPLKGWLLALALLFAFEVIEGITHYRPHSKKLMQLSREAAQQGIMTPKLTATMDNRLANFLLYLDIPNFLIIAALAVFKPF
ncbi:MAG: DUF2269 family protein [Deltaproteobacteria bacterium]|nr:DUF2269 family protein [Deltaproteobacteria bacterium]